MKVRFSTVYLLLYLCMLSQMIECPPGKKLSMFSVFSWNILGPSTQDATLFFPLDAKNSPYGRLRRILNEVKKEFADIICLQELDAQSKDFFDKELAATHFNVVYQSKGKNGGVVLYAKRDSFGCIDCLPVVMGQGAAAVGILRSKKTGTIIVVTSIHLSRGNADNLENFLKGTMQLDILLDEINKLYSKHNLQKPAYKIFAGDFNTQSPEIEFRTLRMMGKKDASLYKDSFPNAITVNNLDGSYKGSIDHIIYSGDLALFLKYSKVAPLTSSLIHNQYPSDHLYQYVVFIDPDIVSAPKLVTSPVVHTSTPPVSVNQVVRALDIMKAIGMAHRSTVVAKKSEKEDRIIRFLNVATAYSNVKK